MSTHTLNLHRILKAAPERVYRAFTGEGANTVTRLICRHKKTGAVAGFCVFKVH